MIVYCTCNNVMLIYNVCTCITQIIGHLPLKYDTYHVFSTPFSLILQHFILQITVQHFFLFFLCVEMNPHSS